MLSLYYYPLNASMAVRFILTKVGAEHELKLVDRKKLEQKSDDYLALNPSGRIPTLVDGDLVLFESPAICLHLARRFVGYALMPLEANARAIFDQWLMYLTNTLQAELMLYSYPDQYASSENCASIVKARAGANINDMLALVDTQLSKQHYLLGDSVSVCDYFLFMLCVWADELAKPPLEFAFLGSYLRRLAQLPEIADVCADEGLDLASYG